MPFALCLMSSFVRRVAVPAVFTCAAGVAGLACANIGNRVIAAPSLRAAADQYALPFAACATACAVMVGSAAAAITRD